MNGRLIETSSNRSVRIGGNGRGLDHRGAWSHPADRRAARPRTHRVRPLPRCDPHDRLARWRGDGHVHRHRRIRHRAGDGDPGTRRRAVHGRRSGRRSDRTRSARGPWSRRADAEAALLAALDGAGLILRATGRRDVIDRLVDDLRRLGPVDHRIGTPDTAEALGPTARAILGLLAEGHSLGEAATILGLPAAPRIDDSPRAGGCSGSSGRRKRSRGRGGSDGSPGTPGRSAERPSSGPSL